MKLKFSPRRLFRGLDRERYERASMNSRRADFNEKFVNPRHKRRALVENLKP